MIARARPCTPVPPLTLHGKEGVDGGLLPGGGPAIGYKEVICLLARLR